jgi:ribonuclease VapC
VSSVLDASALLAYLRDEPGAEIAADAIADGATISTVNLAEVLSRVAARGGDPARLLREATERGLLDGAISIEPFTTADALEVARLRPSTRENGLSLGNRACVALACRLDMPAVTADTAWSKIDLPIEVRQIR